MMNIVITGCAGMIGSMFANWIIRNKPDVRVIGIDDLSGGYIENVNKKVEFHKIDLSKDNFDFIFKNNDIDILYAFQAWAAEGASCFMRTHTYNTNLITTARLINAVINYNVKRLVFTSSMGIYGHGKPPFDENDIPHPIDPYGVAKFACELDIKIAHEQHGLEYTIIRPHNCYSSDTEVLTKDGFKLFKDLLPNDYILTLNTDTNEMEYHIPINFQKYYFKENLINFKGTGVDMAVTPDHKMILKSSRYNKKIHKTVAQEIIDNPQKYYFYSIMRKGFLWNGLDQEYYIIPEIKDSLGRDMKNNHQNGAEKKIKMEDWCEFLGWFISEGCMYETPQNYVVCISQSKNIHPENYNLIKKSISKIKFNYNETDKEIKINSKQLYTHLRNIFPRYKNSKSKYIPRFLLELDIKYLKKMFDSLLLGDGTKDKSIYTTASKQLSDDFQELCIKLGLSATINFGDSRYDIGSFYHRQFPTLGDSYIKNIKYKFIEYDDYVYDITIKNHIILTRRNGCITWSSNCYGENQNIFDNYRNVIGIWMRKILNGEKISIFGDGLQQRALTYIDDITEPLWIAGTSEKTKGEIINLGGIYPTTIIEAAKILRNITGGEIEFLEPRFEVKVAYSTYQKSVDLLGFQHKTSLEDGFKNMWEWARIQPKRPVIKWINEIEKGLYGYWK